VLDAGAGTGLCGQLFARAGLAVHAMDISPALLELCRAKRFAASVSLHDMQDLPWPYPSGAFDHVVCCGVLHFIAVLDAIFGEVARILTGSGVFAFTTKAPARPDEGQDYERQASGSFEIYSHAPAYVRSLLARQGFALLKTQRCFVGDELFIAWVARRHAEARGSDAQ
jgi:predicted TPR repeat methyltransferase